MDETPEPRHCQDRVASAGLIISHISLDVSDILNSVVILLGFLGKSGRITHGRWRRIAGVVPLPPVSTQLAIGEYV